MGSVHIFHLEWKLVVFYDTTKIKQLGRLLDMKLNKVTWFNFIGDISKTLFGTMNESDAQYYNTELDTVIEDNKHLAQLIKNENIY